MPLRLKRWLIREANGIYVLEAWAREAGRDCTIGVRQRLFKLNVARHQLHAGLYNLHAAHCPAFATRLRRSAKACKALRGNAATVAHCAIGKTGSPVVAAASGISNCTAIGVDGDIGASRTDVGPDVAAGDSSDAVVDAPQQDTKCALKAIHSFLAAKAKQFKVSGRVH